MIMNGTLFPEPPKDSTGPVAAFLMQHPINMPENHVCSRCKQNTKLARVCPVVQPTLIVCAWGRLMCLKLELERETCRATAKVLARLNCPVRTALALRHRIY